MFLVLKFDVIHTYSVFNHEAVFQQCSPLIYQNCEVLCSSLAWGRCLLVLSWRCSLFYECVVDLKYFSGSMLMVLASLHSEIKNILSIWLNRQNMSCKTVNNEILIKMLKLDNNLCSRCYWGCSKNSQTNLMQ